jgi:hypothetical protein
MFAGPVGMAVGSQLGSQTQTQLTGPGGPLGSLLGGSGGAGGTGFAAPTMGNITNPVQPGQTDASYAGVQGSLTSQQNLLSALQGQNGVGNQSQVYNQLQGIANGTGPNPAQAQLAQATGANVANQAALMAGQRGAGANVGLMARQAGQQGAATQQNAAGQAATLQAQQSLGALGQMGSLASTQAANQIGQTNANTQAQQAEQAALLNAQQGVNQSNVASQANVNTANAALANTQLQGQQGLIGGLMNGAGAGLGQLFGAQGGMVHAAAGTDVDPSAFQSGAQSKFGQFINGVSANSQAQQAAAAPNSTGAKALQSGSSSLTSGLLSALGSIGGGTDAASTGLMAGGAGDAVIGGGAVGTDMLAAAPLALAAKGGRVPAMVSPGEKYLSPQAVEQVKRGASPMAVGETIGGNPKVGGAKNSYANDTVHKDLEEGGIVVPRSETKSKNPDRASADFVHKVLSKRRR